MLLRLAQSEALQTRGEHEVSGHRPDTLGTVVDDTLEKKILCESHGSKPEMQLDTLQEPTARNRFNAV